MSDVTIYRGKRAINPFLPDSIPELDSDQLDAGDAMFADKDKLLFSDPGAGKTLTALHALVQVYEADATAETIVVCPSIAVMTWAVWIAKVWADIGRRARIHIVKDGKDKVPDDATHIIVTYGLLSRSAHMQRALRTRMSSVLICDESDNLTGLDSARTSAVLGPDGLAKNPTYRWFLTGTPIPRYNDGLWPVLSAIFPDRLAQFDVASKRLFIQTFCHVRKVLYGRMRFPKETVSGSRNTEILKDILFGGERPICIRIKLNLSETPVLQEVTLYPVWTKEFLETEETVMSNSEMFDTEFGADGYVDPKLATAFRLMGRDTAGAVASYVDKQMSKEADRAKHEKRPPLGKLVVYWHKEAGDVLVDKLTKKGWRVARIDGSTSQRHNHEVEHGFNSGRFDIVIGQIKTMGVALNLQKRCDHVIFAEETFSAAMNLQAYQRVWRRGQDKLVKVDYCRPLSALAEMKPRVTQTKARMAAKVLD